MEIAGAVREAVSRDARVTGVELIGSRAEGRAHERSDWDFAVRTDDFGSLRGALPGLVEPLEPLVAQWDRYSDTACYMLVLAGPVKVDLIFTEEPQAWAPPWQVTPETLQAVDDHFWDWALWLDQKARGPAAGGLPAELEKLYQLLLAPLGAQTPPASLEDAVASYLSARARLEQEFGTQVSRRLEEEVRPLVTAAPGLRSRRPGP